MLSKPVGVAVLVAGLMAAAAGGGYLAMRQQAVPTPAAAAAADQAAPPVTSVPPAPTQAPAAADQNPAPPPAPAEVETGTNAPAPAPAVRRRPVNRTPIVRAQTPVRPVERSEAPVVADGNPVSVTPLPEPVAPVSAAEPPPQVRFQEITIPSDTVIGVQVDTTVSSERARVEDQVEGRVTRDVAVGGRVAIPAGTKMIGSVTLVERGGKFKDRARIAVRFHTAQLTDGTRVPLETTAIMREGDSPARESAAKVGGAAVGGAILGAILGGGKGAAIGGTAGAAGGSAVVMAGDRNAATLPAGTTATIRLMSDVTVTVER